jgi:hypothetical protein
MENESAHTTGRCHQGPEEAREKNKSPCFGSRVVRVSRDTQKGVWSFPEVVRASHTLDLGLPPIQVLYCSFLITWPVTAYIAKGAWVVVH